MPVMFVLGLAAVFGDLVETVIGQDYIQFLLPGVLVMQVTLAAGATGVGLATDLRDGIIDRFRSLPMAQISVLTGRTTADLARLSCGAWHGGSPQRTRQALPTGTSSQRT